MAPSLQPVSTITFTSETPERPPNGICEQCGVEIEPLFIESQFGLPNRWHKPASHCDECTDKQRRNFERRKEQERINEAFQRSMITPRFKERTFENFQANEANKFALKAAQEFQITKEGRGLMFYGKFGVGKTHLAAAIANRCIGKHSVLYVPCPELLYEIRKSFNTPQDSGKLEMAKRVQFLILDDIGAEKPTDWVRETLFVLINHRYEHKLSTIFTTNCSLEELEDKLTGRITSRIAETCRLFEIRGKDWRLTKMRRVA